ncbi:MAG: Gfo/Idh/MocA family oxidoreductase [Rikenellaceae bacterium]
MKKIKYGMIGGGIGAFIGDAHRRAARISNQFELLGGVFDIDYEQGQAFAKLEDLDLNRCYPNIEKFIEGELSLPSDQRIEAVAIVTPNFFHFSQAKILLENGFNVMCEKPMTLTVEDAQELKMIVEKRGASFALMHTYTGYPMIREMKSLISQGVIGDIQRVDAQYYQGWINSIIHDEKGDLSKVWRLNPKYSGISSCMADIGVHAFNMVEYVTGVQVKSVLADLNNIKETVKMDLDGTVLLRFDDNFKGVIRASQVAVGEANRLEIRVYGSKGGLKWSQENPNELYLMSDTEPTKVYTPGNSYNGDFAAMSQKMPAGHPEGIYESMANIYAGFAKSIHHKEYIDGEFPTVDDGVRGLKFVHSVVKSSSLNCEWIEI